jgi:hypothetical protein
MSRSISSLVTATSTSLECSRLASSVLSSLIPWNVPGTSKNKFLDAYDSGDIKKASKICREMVPNEPMVGHEAIVNLVYMCIRGDMETPIDGVAIPTRTPAIQGPTRTRVKNELHAISSKKWPYIPLDRILWALRKNDLVPLQEDGTVWSGMLMGEKECGAPGSEDQYADFPLAKLTSDGELHITNASVHLTWCLFNSNTRSFEIVVYMG